MKVEPPAGWSIEPSEISLLVDGVNDACSKGQDVNFAFTGFGITGRVVTTGSSVGPAGVSVHLIGENGDVRDTKTKFNGDFHFTPVIPGKYTVKAYHHKLVFCNCILCLKLIVLIFEYYSSGGS